MIDALFLAFPYAEQLTISIAGAVVAFGGLPQAHQLNAARGLFVSGSATSVTMSVSNSSFVSHGGTGTCSACHAIILVPS